jgi:hypothetical protein
MTIVYASPCFRGIIADIGGDVTAAQRAQDVSAMWVRERVEINTFAIFKN